MTKPDGDEFQKLGQKVVGEGKKKFAVAGSGGDAIKDEFHLLLCSATLLHVGLRKEKRIKNKEEMEK